MSWSVPFYAWLVSAAIQSFCLLLAGSLIVLCVREPVRRIRVIELTFWGCLLVPCLGLIPGYPSLSYLEPAWYVPSIADGASRPTEAAIPEAVASHSIGEIETGHEAMSDTDLDVQHPLSVADNAAHVDERSMRPMREIPVASTPASTEDRNFADVSNSNEFSTATHQSAVPVQFQWDFRLLVVGGYLLGFGCMCAWWVLGFISLRRILCRAVPADAHCRETFGEVAGAAGHRVALLVSNEIEHPFTCRWHRPAIVLPSRLTKIENSDVLKWCLAHEWSHVANGDLRRWHLSGVVRACFFYQPLVWLLRRHLQLCQDYLADNAAARMAGSSEDYAQFLVNSVAAHAGRPVAALGINGQRSTLSRRVVMLVQNPRPLKTRCPRIWSGTAFVVAVVFVTLIAALRGPAAAVTFADSDLEKAEGDAVELEADRAEWFFSNGVDLVFERADGSSLEISARDMRITQVAAEEAPRSNTTNSQAKPATDDPYASQVAGTSVGVTMNGNVAVWWALSNPLGKELNLKTIEQFAESLEQALGVEVQLDQGAMADDAFDSRGPLGPQETLRTGITVCSALDRFLSPLQLTWIVRDEALVITTTSAAQNIRTTKIYDVTDLVPPRLKKDKGDKIATADEPTQQMKTRSADSIGSLMATIAASTGGPNSGEWREEGGEGTITPTAIGGAQALVVRQTQAVHGEIETLLADLRMAKSNLRQPQGVPVSAVSPDEAACARSRWRATEAVRKVEAGIRESLENRLQEDFDQNSLKQFAQFLGREIGSDVQIDARALSDDAIQIEEGMPHVKAGITVRSVLDRTLRPFQLTWIVKDEALVITTTTAAQNTRETKVYNIADLSPSEPAAEKKVPNFGPLMMIIESSTGGPNLGEWREDGGEGTMLPLITGEIPVLVVRQTQAVHEQIGAILSDLRKLPRTGADQP